jgi:hypothetical protein
MRSWLKWTGFIATLAMASTAVAADHRDGPGVKMDPAADINDVYGFTDANNLVMAVTVFPAADAAAKFSDTVQYAFHLDTGTQFGETLEGMDVICTFDAAQVASCWAGTKDYVTGDASAQGGITSESGMFKVFAGMRGDPFYFNLDGFNDAVATVVSVAGMMPPPLTFDAANCPNVDAATSGVLVGMLQGTNQGADPAVDFFKALNTLSIVVSIDRSLLNPEHNLVAIWSSTHRAP